MAPKFAIEYTTQFQSYAPPNQYTTDDAASCEGFIQGLVQRGFKITRIRHQGLELPHDELAGIVKDAKCTRPGDEIAALLKLKPEDKKSTFRFI